MQFHFGLSVVFAFFHHRQVCLNNVKFINSAQNCSYLSIVNPHPQLQYARRAFDAGLPWRNCQYQYRHNPLKFQYFIAAQHSDQTDLSNYLHTDLLPPFSWHTFVWDCLWTCFMESITPFRFLPPPLSHFPSASLSRGSDVMSVIAARWWGTRKNRINLVSPEPSLSPLLLLSSIRYIN